MQPNDRLCITLPPLVYLNTSEGKELQRKIHELFALQPNEEVEKLKMPTCSFQKTGSTGVRSD